MPKLSVPRILLIGDDFALLATRAAVLARTGANTICCNPTELKKDLDCESFDLAVLCHSLSEGEASEASALVRERWPNAKIFLMESKVPLDKMFDGLAIDGTISSSPAVLLEQTSELLQT